MVMVRLVFKRQFHFLKKEDGQSSVEYLMLMAVAIFLVTTVIRSDYFQEFFGEEGQFSTAFRQEIEFGYRNALHGREFFREPNYRGDIHPSYVNGGTTRFFGAKDQYPK